MPQNHELSIPGNPISRAEYEIKSDQIVGNDACPCLGDGERGERGHHNVSPALD